MKLDHDNVIINLINKKWKKFVKMSNHDLKKKKDIEKLNNFRVPFHNF